MRKIVYRRSSSGSSSLTPYKERTSSSGGGGGNRGGVILFRTFLLIFTGLLVLCMKYIYVDIMAILSTSTPKPGGASFSSTTSSSSSSSLRSSTGSYYTTKEDDYQQQQQNQEQLWATTEEEKNKFYEGLGMLGEESDENMGEGNPPPDLRTMDGTGSNEHDPVTSTTTATASSNNNNNNNNNIPRPRNMRLVFVGDSLTRYQYLSLVYFLKFGQWLNPVSDRHSPNNLVYSHSFHHPMHPYQNWNEFFWQSNRMLYPFEACDCLRETGAGTNKISMERRYFYEPSFNNTVVFINLNGNVTTMPGRGYFGRWDASDIFQHFNERYVGMPIPPSWRKETSGGGNATSSSDIGGLNISWEYPLWGDVLRHHVAKLGMLGFSSDNNNDTVVVLNAGLHPHKNLHLNTLVESIQDSGYKGIWKTTTFRKTELLRAHRGGGNNDENKNLSLSSSSSSSISSFAAPHYGADEIMCQRLECFNLSWTQHLLPALYLDEFHFAEPVYRVLNEELLDQLGWLPHDYTGRLNRSTILTTTAP